MEAGRVQPLRHHLRDSGEQLVSEIVILVALAAQAGSVQREGAHGLHRAAVEAPAVGRDEPRPTEYVTFADSLEGRWRAAGRLGLYSDHARPDEIEPVGLL